MAYVLVFIVGVIVGAGIAAGIFHAHQRRADERMRQAFVALAAEALDANTRRLIEMMEGAGRQLSQSASADLNGKKALIDQSVTAVGEKLEAVRQALQRIEADRKQEFGRLTQSVTSLSATAGELHKVLASTQRRGAWGERMAEDVLRLSGMQEGVNYLKQSAEHAEAGRADFTFLLPNNLKVNMDVKFPLEKYRAYLDAPDDSAREARLRELCEAVRGHVRDVAKRGYIDPSVPTVPYVIVFLPSEQVFGLVMQGRPDLADEALAQRVVLCGPLTLYAMLAVIRQAAENYNVTKTADEVIAMLGEFAKQWQKFSESLDAVGVKIEQTAKAYQEARTTRTNVLLRPLERIEEIRRSRELPP